jgi:hypothetical protein
MMTTSSPSRSTLSRVKLRGFDAQRSRHIDRAVIQFEKCAGLRRFYWGLVLRWLERSI